MKKISACFLLVIVLLHATPLLQLLKVPVLIEHYEEHRELDPYIGFFDFLSMHYWGEDQNDNDQERDMELPFRKANLQQVAFEYAAYLNSIPLMRPVIIWAPGIDYPILPDTFFPDSYKGALFKPPRV